MANAGNDATLTLPVHQATLNGSASHDPDGSINQYTWTKLSGPSQLSMGSAGSVYCALSNLVEGTYTFRLVVTDNYGHTGDDTVKVFVNPAPNIVPVARAGSDTILFFPVSSVVLNGNGSYDPDGAIASFNWVRLSGPGSATLINSTASTPTITGLLPGVHVIQLTVTDNKGKTATDQINITVNTAINRPPVAHAGKDTSITGPSASVYLDATGSKDVDGNIAQYSWKQVTGSPGARIDQPGAAITAVNNLEVGDYEFEITVTDNKGSKAKDTVKVSVMNNFRYEEQLTLYPNPARGIIRVQCISDSMGMTMIRIIDLNGKTISKVIVEKQQFLLLLPINLQELKTGMYFIEVTLNNKKKMISKFVRL